MRPRLPTPDSPLGRRLVRRGKLYILPTRYGLLFMLVLLAMLWGSSNYNNNLGFALTFLLGAMTFVSMFHTHRTLKGLGLEPPRARPVFAGEEAVFGFQVRAGARPRHGLELRLGRDGPDADRANGPSDHLDLEAGHSGQALLRWPAAERGVLRPPPLQVRTVHPFGLFRAWTWPRVDARCVVYPRPAQGNVDLAFGRVPGDASGESAQTGPGADDFDGLRAYRPGDPPQRIAWKASSRGQGLLTKHFVGRFGSSALLDWDALPGGDDEHRLSLLCAMVLRAHALGMHYGLRLPGTTIQPGRSQRHMRRCLEALALFGLDAPRPEPDHASGRREAA